MCRISNIKETKRNLCAFKGVVGLLLPLYKIRWWNKGLALDRRFVVFRNPCVSQKCLYFGDYTREI